MEKDFAEYKKQFDADNAQTLERLKETERQFEILVDAKSEAELNQAKAERQYELAKKNLEDEIRVRVEFELKISKLYNQSVTYTNRNRGLERTVAQDAVEKSNLKEQIFDLERQVIELQNYKKRTEVIVSE